MTRRIFRGLFVLALCAAMIAGGHGAIGVGAQPRSTSTSTASVATPIKHVVIIFQENHSFDNVLGPLCVNVLHNRCNGSIVGKKHDNSPQPLRAAADLVPEVDHSDGGQLIDINSGAMNGFDLNEGCEAPTFSCYSAYQPPLPGNPGFIPNVTTLAENYVISDATFERSPQPSWGSHLSFVAAQLDGSLVTTRRQEAPERGRLGVATPRRTRDGGPLLPVLLRWSRRVSRRPKVPAPTDLLPLSGFPPFSTGCWPRDSTSSCTQTTRPGRATSGRSAQRSPTAC
jgi:hypothetical protein